MFQHEKTWTGSAWCLMCSQHGKRIFSPGTLGATRVQSAQLAQQKIWAERPGAPADVIHTSIFFFILSVRSHKSELWFARPHMNTSIIVVINILTFGWNQQPRRWHATQPIPSCRQNHCARFLVPASTKTEGFVFWSETTRPLIV